MQEIPQSLLKDAEWASMLHVVLNVSKLSRYFTPEYFDLGTASVKVDKLTELAKPWSSGERIMLQLALHLYNGHEGFVLDDLDRLDERLTRIAFEAMAMRYNLPLTFYSIADSVHRHLIEYYPDMSEDEQRQTAENAQAYIIQSVTDFKP